MNFLTALLVLCPQSAQAPLLHHTFAAGVEGWSILQLTGSGAKVSTTSEAANVRPGSAALKVEYDVAQGQTSFAVLPAPPQMAKMQSLKFWIKADQATTMALSIQEREGGRFSTVLSVPKGAWQPVEIGLGDLMLGVGQGDPKDANGKLDLDKLEMLSLGDFQQFIAQNADFASIAGVQNGARAFYLSDFQISAAALPDTTTSGAEFRFDTYARPQIAWASLGGPELKIVADGRVTGKALRASYRTLPGKLMALVRVVRAGSLTGKTVAKLQIASAKPAKLLIQLEETTGGKYNAILDIKGGSTSNDYDYLLSALIPSDDSKDDNGKLDVDKVHQLVLIDVTSLFESAEQDNVIWLGSIVAKS
ncbi:MAG TPA: hypothetical protein VK934_03170 [Fimbriimonas sp.]|nr:hypothetical protein [Fimbriimonas sp.]